MGAIDDIKAKLDIIEIISSSGVSLRRTGRSYVGFCPFHPNTRTPAFTVYPDSQSFYCFGCHASGTVFDFVMRRQGLDFREALEQLAARAGVQLSERSDEERQIDQRRTRLLEICAAAARYFNYVLVSLQRGQPGRDYVAKRGISAETVEAFQLGFSLDEWGHLLSYLTDRKGFAPEEVEAAGLAIHHEQRGFYDRFRGRVIFPIRGVKGEVVGFGGRALGDAQPKYLNTPETLLFKKGELLYGLDLARDAIRAADAAVVVEGYVDVITAHQHGFRNIVAPLGTALNRGHIAILKKLSPNIYLALDADVAGQKATLRGLNVSQEADGEDETARPVVTAQGMVMWQNDVNLRIIKLPPGRDPDEVIKADPSAWQALVAAAAPVMEFYIDAYTADLDPGQPQSQRAALDRLLPLLAQLDGIQQRVYINRVEQAVGVKAELILDLLRGGRQAAARTSAAPPQRNQPPGANARAAAPRQSPADHPQPPASREDHLLALALRYPTVLPAVEELLEREIRPFPQVRQALGGGLASLIERTENREIWRAWQAAGIASPTEPTALAAWVEALDPALREQVARLLTIELPRAQEYRYRQEAEKTARQLRIGQTRRIQLRLSQQLQESADAAEQARLDGLLKEFTAYLAAISAPRRTATFTDLRDTLGQD